MNRHITVIFGILINRIQYHLAAMPSNPSPLGLLPMDEKLKLLLQKYFFSPNMKRHPSEE